MAAFAIGPATSFVEKINDVNLSIGRLSSPVFPGEALGIWPQGDFRIVRGDVSGSLIAVAVGGLAVAYGAWALYRRRQFAILAVLVTGAIVYVGAREFAQIHVQAKALVVIAPLVLLVSLRALAAPDGPAPGLRYAAGVLVGLAALGSTLLALRAAPVGYDDRQVDLERLAEKVDGSSVVFLGVDRFSGYYLRGTLMRAPAGYVPQDIASRPEKAWQQGWAADFDNLEPAKLDKFEYAITTDAAYASTPPPNFEPVARSGDYVLWRRDGDGPRSRVLREGGDPGAILHCQSAEGRRLAARKGTAVVLDTPVVVDYTDWRRPPLVDDAAGGQELGFDAPGTASADLNLPAPGRYRVSLQYHSQVPLTVLYEGRADRPPPTVARRHVPQRRRPRRVLAGGRVYQLARDEDDQRPRRRPDRAPGRARRRAPRLARRPRRKLDRRTARRADEATRAATTSTTSRSSAVGRAGADAAPRNSGRARDARRSAASRCRAATASLR